MGVGDQVSAVAGEQPVDRRAVVVARVAEEHVLLRGDGHPEVTGAAPLLREHEDAGGVHAQVRLRESVHPPASASSSGCASSASVSCHVHIVDFARTNPSRA